MKKILLRTILYGVAAIIAYKIYEQSLIKPESDQDYCERTGRVMIHGRFFKYDVLQNGEMKPISDMLSKGCNNEAYCEINNAYQYVLGIPYKESKGNKTPSDVINQNGGDCDEKSFLLATLLLERGHDCLFVTTKDHGFIAVHLGDESVLESPYSYIVVNKKHYYIAETATENGRLGADNNISKDHIEGVFDMVAKKEIPMHQVELHRN